MRLEGARLVEEFKASPPTVRAYVVDELAELRAEPYFDYAVEGATASYGPLGSDRARIVRARLDELMP